MSWVECFIWQYKSIGTLWDYDDTASWESVVQAPGVSACDQVDRVNALGAMGVEILFKQSRIDFVSASLFKVASHLVSSSQAVATFQAIENR
jgi:hypothetical protein